MQSTTAERDETAKPERKSPTYRDFIASVIGNTSMPGDVSNKDIEHMNQEKK